jgi:alkylation response protein AidB-like acyl-CoA dehydrogenase
MAAPDLDTFTRGARAWLESNATRKTAAETTEQPVVWGQGEFSVSVFHNLTFAEEQAVLDEAAAWTQKKSEVGYHAITWPEQYGGLGLPTEYQRAFHRLEAEYVTPGGHETHSVTTHLMAPTLRILGNDWQKERLVRSFLEARELCCQLFSEPGAGSDLASVSTRADRDGDEWVLNGQKVWSSGAQFSPWGMAVCRSDPDLPKHKGITVFVLPMDSPGVEVRPIRQMSGGTSFNEVFLTDVRVPDQNRVGDIGEGWKVALTVLGFERGSSDGSNSRVGGSWNQVRALAEHFEVTTDPIMRQKLIDLYIRYRLMGMTRMRIASQTKAGQAPGPEGSIGKIFWTQSMTAMSEVVAAILGPRLAADSGEWGTYAWNDHVLGAPGYRIAGGSDEIQRNIVGERVLGLPGEPRVDKDIPYRDVAK